MKIMLLSSIRNRNSAIDKANKKIIQTLEPLGHKLYHDQTTKADQKYIDSLSPEEELKFHKKTLETIKKSDILIVECSHQSLSLGFLMSYAFELNKPIILFYDKSAQKPNLFPTLTFSELILVSKYKDLTELGDLVKDYVEYASEKIDIRFNFFISPAHANYLDWIARNRKIPRSVYIRSLIESDMEDNKEYTQ